MEKDGMNNCGAESHTELDHSTVLLLGNVFLLFLLDWDYFSVTVVIWTNDC